MGNNSYFFAARRDAPIQIVIAFRLLEMDMVMRGEGVDGLVVGGSSALIPVAKKDPLVTINFQVASARRSSLGPNVLRIVMARLIRYGNEDQQRARRAVHRLVAGIEVTHFRTLVRHRVRFPAILPCHRPGAVIERQRLVRVGNSGKEE